jgi:hypothetical protein
LRRLVFAFDVWCHVLWNVCIMHVFTGVLMCKDITHTTLHIAPKTPNTHTPLHIPLHIPPKDITHTTWHVKASTTVRVHVLCNVSHTIYVKYSHYYVVSSSVQTPMLYHVLYRLLCCIEACTAYYVVSRSARRCSEDIGAVKT